MKIFVENSHRLLSLMLIREMLLLYFIKVFLHYHFGNKGVEPPAIDLSN